MSIRSLGAGANAGTTGRAKGLDTDADVDAKSALARALDIVAVVGLSADTVPAGTKVADSARVVIIARVTVLRGAGAVGATAGTTILIGGVLAVYTAQRQILAAGGLATSQGLRTWITIVTVH